MTTSEKLKAFMSKTGMSQSQIANLIGKSTAVVNQYLQGKYKGNNKDIDRLVEQMLERQIEKQDAPNNNYVDTPTAKRILTLVSMTHSLQGMTVIIGEAGVGKTVTLKQYAKTHGDVILIEVDPTYNQKALLSCLCRELGVPPRTNHLMFGDLVEKLTNSNRLIIIDEAELLPTKLLETLRRLQDKTEDTIGIILAGMPRLHANLKGARGEHKQLFNRVIYNLDLGAKVADEELAEIATAQMNTSEHNEALLKASHGNARRLNRLIKGVVAHSNRLKQPITAHFIEQFSEMLIK